MVRLSGPGCQHQEQFYLREILLETSLFYKTLEGLIGFLAFLVQKLWGKKAKKLGKSPEIPLGIIYNISNEAIFRLKSPQ